MSVSDDLVPECPPPETDDEEDFVEITSGISAAIGITSDLKGALSTSDLSESWGEVLSRGSVTGSYRATAIPEDKTKPDKNRHLKSGGAFCINFAVIRIPFGEVGPELGVWVLRLCRASIDLSDASAIEQFYEQVQGILGCAIHGSSECRPWS